MRHRLPNGEIVRARAEAVYPTLTPGSVTLVHSDGPYNLGKAAWDRVKDLAAWYRPHIAAWGEVCAPSASVYLWNTAAGWAAVHPEMLGAGWTFRSLIVWDKQNTAASMAWQKSSTWPATHEVCGYYTRGAPYFRATDPRSVWSMAVQGWADERLTTGTMRPGARNQDGVGCVVAEALHPTQKPLAFVRRILEASSQPGDLVLVPFGGTCREAVAIEHDARLNLSGARRYVVVEMDEDGREYIAAVLNELRGERPGATAQGQMRLFGATK